MNKADHKKQCMRLYENTTRLKLTTPEQLASVSGLSLRDVKCSIESYNGIAVVMRENAKQERRQELYNMVMSVMRPCNA